MNLGAGKHKGFQGIENSQVLGFVCATLGLRLFLLTWYIKTYKLHIPLFYCMYLVYIRKGCAHHGHIWTLDDSCGHQFSFPPWTRKAQTQNIWWGITHFSAAPHRQSVRAHIR